MQYRLVPLALLCMLVLAAGSLAHAGNAYPPCATQQMARVDTHAVVGSGRLCVTRAALQLQLHVKLPAGSYTVTFHSAWYRAGSWHPGGTAVRTLHVNGGTTVFVYDHVPVVRGVAAYTDIPTVIRRTGETWATVVTGLPVQPAR